MKRVVAIMAFVGCVHSNSVQCPDEDRVCPAGLVCITVPSPLCVSQDQITACAGMPDNTTCDPGFVVEHAYCHDGVCFGAECGNELVDDALGTTDGLHERCDDGNNVSGDGCSADCASTEVCGNGTIDTVNGEECDDPYGPADAFHGALSHDGCSSTCRTEAPTWTMSVAGSEPRVANHAIAYDIARDRIVVFGGLINAAGQLATGTHEWDGHGWILRSEQPQPPARHGAVMAYDAKRRKTVLFGGVDPRGSATSFGDTWEWDGRRWRLIETIESPQARRDATMIYDPIRGKVILFGGNTSASGITPVTDTWAFDGTTWELLFPAGASAPSARFDHAMAYDPARGVTVLQGGRFGAGTVDVYQDTWELDAVGWSQRATTGPKLEHHVLVFDAMNGRVMAFEGLNWTTNQGVHVWDGAAWSSSVAVTNPVLDLGAVTTARGDIVRVGGSRTTPTNETATWNGTSWSLASFARPAPRYNHAMVADRLRGRLIAFGGEDATQPVQLDLNDTWLAIGAGWKQHVTTMQPPPRHSHAMAYDAKHDRVVLFGGYRRSNNQVFGDTWLFDGTNWSQVAMSTPRPSPRLGAVMTYDEERDEVLLFGGRATDSAVTGFSDLWAWDGTAWREHTTSPHAGYDSTLSYDPIRGITLLFGGGGAANATYTWNGASWKLVTSTQKPQPRQGAMLAWNPALGRNVLFGGKEINPAVVFNDTWLFDGAQWNPAPVPTSPPVMANAALATSNSGVMLFGGHLGLGGNAFTPTDLTASLIWDGASPSESCATGLDGDGDGAIGCADADCWSICDPLCLPGTPSCEQDRPRCGDATCGAIESCRSCPGDCGACMPVCGDAICDPGEANCPADCP